MKKFYVFAVACVGLLATACGGNKEAKEEAMDTIPVEVVEEGAAEEVVDTATQDTAVVEVVEAEAAPVEAQN